MQLQDVPVLLNGILPIIGGLALTLISYRVVGRKWKIADPDLESVWEDTLKVMRYGGPMLILIGVFIVLRVINGA